ncbi:calponin homology domain protein [Aspergillus saccharolyticus JOP 1030-1]|uniref:Calponin-homology (CH) domain-containing protein n=1 Tax=Aspergillus saccharolyticus JOP 1030-1 TaxID=1450539 RepID=A0A318ZQX4_9EURO|nr:hypothetical protein BP01DRAFT_337120 [Aspergillus saccharolyticus JOP 1030-1]PYH46763.1 hypothetical protein BP01DRAFT_337120 [Aspergillus saccharolyticus JOP 1030-1]
MASVTSLDKDLRNLRLSRYTPQAAAEVRSWIEEVLHEKLPAGDLLEALKDGVALCKLVNLAVSPGVKYKQSSMPFVQMENISHFLRACQMPPLSLPPHDVFLTVDLYEAKDPAQVLQCLTSFSRRANALQPNKFPYALGPQSKGNSLSPHVTGSSQGGAYTPTRSRGFGGSDSGHTSPARSPQPVSSWSKRSDEHSTAPAWNIHQYGYMGGASQGNQGVAFGARRQITTAAPHVPSLAEKEKRRREEEERRRIQELEDERRRQQQLEAEEEQARLEEERRWEEETARAREQERLQVEAERKRWDQQQREWQEEERKRQREERETEERLEKERLQRREAQDSRLNGQFLSQYQASMAGSGKPAAASESQERQRIRQLEHELERAKERERQYERERQEDARANSPETARSPRKVPVPPKPSYDLSSLEQERRLLRGEWQKHNSQDHEGVPTPIAESPASPPPPSSPRRPLPEPNTGSKPAPPPRPLPDPAAYASPPQSPSTPRKPVPISSPVRGAGESRIDRFLSFNRPPSSPKPATHRPADFTTTAEVDAENSRRLAAQEKTKAGGWASKSLLEREMERERERQREWEESQKQTQEAAAKGLRDGTLGSGPGQAWDVHQYGYMGGDNQNRGGPGLGVGGARRQIIGSRPPQ